jgi:hypothetical protein
VTWVSWIFLAAVITGFARASPLLASHGVSSRYHPGVPAGFGPIAGLKIGHASTALGTSAQDDRALSCCTVLRPVAQAFSL